MTTPRTLSFVVGTGLLTASLAVACGPKRTVNEGPEEPPHVNEGPTPEPADAGEGDAPDPADDGTDSGPSSDTDPPEEVIEGEFPIPPSPQP